MPESSKYLREDFVLDNGHLLDQVLKRKWYSSENSPQGAWDNIAEQMLLEFAESGHPTFRATTPLSRGVFSRAKDMENCRYISLQMDSQLKQFFELSFLSISSVSTEQWRLYVKNLRIIKMDQVNLIGQSIVFGEIKEEVLLRNENSLNHQFLWQQYMERIESLSPESKVSRFCMEAGFMCTVEVGQYFMTKDTGHFRQVRSVACREYILPRDDPASQPKGWIQGNIRIGTVLEVTTSFQNYKFGIEIRIWSVGHDNSQSWDRISHGTIKYVIDSKPCRKSCRSTRRSSATNKYQGCCIQIKGKSKTTTERTCWYTNCHTDARKKMDWYWNIRTNSRCVRSLEESDLKIWAEDRQYSFCLLIQETKIIKILNILTSLYHVERNTCTVHGRGIKTRYSGLILILRLKRD